MCEKTIKERELKRSCVSVSMSLPRAYEVPHEPGALDGVEPFAKAHQLKTPEAQQILQSVFSYTLHKPRRTRFPTTPTVVFDRDEQFQMDLVDMRKLSRCNKGHKYLLTVIDVLSKYAWAVPIKSKSSQEMIRRLERIYKQASPQQPLRVQTDKGKKFYNTGVQGLRGGTMASHLETTDVPLLYSPQYVTVRGRVTTVDPYVQSILSSEYSQQDG